MFVVTFYSYKGGVGRTSALVNVAYRLANRGKRVFVLDFDLEAPGIDSYKLTNAGSSPGIVEYISEFIATGKVPNLQDFVLESNALQNPGRLFLMRGGRKDDNYKISLSQLNWKFLYRQKKGFFLIENLKASIEQLFKPDYLLVDARTGLTDISGICTLQLPHLVVLLFSLNQQNIVGVNEVLQSIRSNKINREIGTLLVASPVPDMPEWVEERSARFDFARKTMGSPADVVIPYDPFLAFGECIVDVKNHGQVKSHLAAGYDLLAEKIITSNRSDIITLLNRAKELVKEGQHDVAESHFRGVVDTIPHSFEAWLEFGRFERLRGRLKRACEYYEKAYSLMPTDGEVLAQLTTTYGYVDHEISRRYFNELLNTDHDAGRIYRVSSALQNSGLVSMAVEGFTKVVQLLPNNSAAYIDLGQAQMHLQRYREAIEAYSRALAFEPNSLPCTFNIGLAYQRLNDTRAIEYFRKAIDIFEQTGRPAEKVQLANAYEAMSRAYFAVGKNDRGLQLLDEAVAIAKDLPNARIFSSTRYEYIPQMKFMSEVTTRLLEARRKLASLNVAEGRHKKQPLN